jgi:hypothetical protein
MFKACRNLALMFLLVVGTGCEWMYVSELKTSGTWTGTATTMALVPEGKGDDIVQVSALHITNGPKWTDPGHRSKVDVIGRDMVLIDEHGTASPPVETQGAMLEVRGLMRTVAVFDQRGRRLYADERRKYLLPSIRVDAMKPMGGRTKVLDTVVLLSDATTQTTTAPTMKLEAKAVSDEQIDLTWTPIEKATQYRIEISEDGKEFYDSTTVDASEPRVSNGGLFPEQTHYFRVTAVGNDADLAVSNVVKATTLKRGATSKESK